MSVKYCMVKTENDTASAAQLHAASQINAGIFYKMRPRDLISLFQTMIGKSCKAAWLGQTLCEFCVSVPLICLL